MASATCSMEPNSKNLDQVGIEHIAAVLQLQLFVASPQIGNTRQVSCSATSLR